MSLLSNSVMKNVVWVRFLNIASGKHKFIIQKTVEWYNSSIVYRRGNSSGKLTVDLWYYDIALVLMAEHLSQRDFPRFLNMMSHQRNYVTVGVNAFKLQFEYILRWWKASLGTENMHSFRRKRQFKTNYNAFIKCLLWKQDFFKRTYGVMSLNTTKP